MACQLVRSTAIIKLICKMPQNAIAQIGLKSSPSRDRGLQLLALK